jgi:dTDP-4-dehydrorhamnose reductase
MNSSIKSGVIGSGMAGKETVIDKDSTENGTESQSVLVVGADGTIGRCLVETFERQGIAVWSTTRQQERVNEKRIFLDLAEPVGEQPLPQITTAILCAGVTSLERCRQEPALTRRINVENTVALARRLVDAGVFVIFPSSNTVFDGQTAFPKATDPTNPQIEYGRQKAEAEAQLLDLGKQIAIVRFSKIFPARMSLLMNWARDLRAGQIIHPFLDCVIAPVSLRLAIDVISRVSTQQLPNITQVSAINDISYEQVARHIATKLSLDIKLIQPISYRQAGIQICPRHTTLDTSRLAALGLDAPIPTDALDQQ